MSIGIIIAAVFIVLLIAVGIFAFVYVGGDTNAAKANIRDMMGGVDPDQIRASQGRSDDPYDVEALKARTGRAKSKKKKETMETRMFKAGIFTAKERAKFKRFQTICLFTFPPVLALAGHFFMRDNFMTVMFLVVGIFAGLSYPTVRLEKKIEFRQDQTLYYLPLVIEQVSIGVSSALDIGPCVSNIVTMATERDSHNPVTEMLVHVEKLMKSGLSLQDGMVEVGETSGISEVKHAFMFLAQCAEHGGEISRQLQELADSVMVQRQTQVEAKIIALPVKATGPLAMVFAGFFGLLFAGIFIRMMKAFV